MAPASEIIGRISASCFERRRSSARASARVCSDTEPSLVTNDRTVRRFTSIFGSLSVYDCVSVSNRIDNKLMRLVRISNRIDDELITFSFGEELRISKGEDDFEVRDDFQNFQTIST